MTGCLIPAVVKLGREDRDYLHWAITGQSPSAVVSVELEDSGVLWPLVVGSGQATGYFAGPDFPAPGTAHVVPVTSHCTLRVVDEFVSLTLDGGMIQLVP